MPSYCWSARFWSYGSWCGHGLLGYLGLCVGLALLHGVNPDWLLLGIWWLVTWGGLVFLAAASIHGLLQQRSVPRLVLLLAVLLSSLTVPDATWRLNRVLVSEHWGFRLRAPLYQSVVDRIHASVLTADATGQVDFGAPGAILSADGRITVNHTAGVTTVIFYEDRGILGEFAGYVYRSDGSPSDRCDFSEPLLHAPSPWSYCVDF